MISIKVSGVCCQWLSRNKKCLFCADVIYKGQSIINAVYKRRPMRLIPIPVIDNEAHSGFPGGGQSGAGKLRILQISYQS